MSVVYDEIIFHVELNISVVSDKTIFQVILIAAAVSVVNDEIIFNVILEIIVVSVINDRHFGTHTLRNTVFKISGVTFEIMFYVVSKISVLSDETISYLVLKISAVSVVCNGIIFHVVISA